MENSIKSDARAGQMHRGLKNRHIQMIAIGGAIGVGLFYGSGGAMQLAGPSIALAYLIGGIFVFLIMRAMGELSVADPVSGSFSYYATRYLGRFAGFLSGWTYWLLGINIIMAELTVAGIYIKFWLPSFPQWLAALIFLIFIVTINLISVKAYGEFEFWFSLIKVVAIIGMIVLGFLMIAFGIGNGGQPVGFSNLWSNGGFFANGLEGFLLCFVLVAFSFGGVELIGVTAGEAENPQKTIPKAINSVFWRILVFYVGALFVMVALYPWNKVGSEGSPFVLVFDKMGIPAAATIINFVVLTAALSGMNSAFYAIGRLLNSLSINNNAPKAFSKISKWGVPVPAVVFTSGISLIAVVLNFVLPAIVFQIFSSIAVVAVITAWGTILLAQLKARKMRQAAGEEIAFKMPLWPVSSYMAIAFLVLILVGMAFLPDMRIVLYFVPVWIGILLLMYKLLAKKDKKTIKAKTEI